MALGQWTDKGVARILEGMLVDPGPAFLVTGLSPYLPQGFPKQTREDNDCLRGSDWLQQAGQERWLSLDLEFLAALIVCGFVCWGGAAWIDRR